eukprot:jgi/Tetstr1/462487/TSEL_007478.t1
MAVSRLLLLAVAGCCFAAAAVAAPYYDSTLDFKTGVDPNLALRKPTYVSSVHNGEEDTSGRAVDGDISHFGNCVHTSEQNWQWWSVDLEETHFVKYVKVYDFVDYARWWQDNLDSGFYLEIAVDVDAEGSPIWTGTEGINHEGDVSSLRRLYGATGIFRVDADARFVRVLRNGWGMLNICEVEVYAIEPTVSYSVPQLVIDAANAGAPVACSDAGPLAQACEDKLETYNNDAAMALAAATMEGPIDCGGRGFFCRMKKDEYFSGTPYDQLYNNYNYGYCMDTRVENPDNNFPGNFDDPERDDGHCHGSNLDSVYHDVLEDHYHRIYRGTLECCCGAEVTPSNADGYPEDRDAWKPAPNFIYRCDYRGPDGNNGNYNFDDGCGGDVVSGDYTDPSNFISPADFKQANTDVCWETKHFGRQPVFYSGPNPLVATTANPTAFPPYPQPTVSLITCTNSAETPDWEGCLMYASGRSNSNLVVLISTEATPEPRSLKHLDVWDDKPHACSDVHNVRVGSANLEYHNFNELDSDGQQAGYVRVTPAFNDGDSVYIQVWDTETCMMSELASGSISTSTGGNRRLLMT